MHLFTFVLVPCLICLKVFLRYVNSRFSSQFVSWHCVESVFVVNVIVFSMFYSFYSFSGRADGSGGVPIFEKVLKSEYRSGRTAPASIYDFLRSKIYYDIGA